MQYQNLSIQQLAEKSGVHATTIQKLEAFRLFDLLHNDINISFLWKVI